MRVRDLAPLDDDEDDCLILTAAHLFEDHPPDARVAFSDAGLEPAAADNNAKHCGVVRRRVPLKLVRTIAVDAAVIKPPHGLDCCNDMACGKLRGVRDLWPGDETRNVEVRKHGAQTGETTGTLQPVAADVRMRDIKVRYSEGWWAYGDGQPFAERGDSGAIVVDAERNAVGMLVAVEHDGEQPGAFVHGINQILSALEVAPYED